MCSIHDIHKALRDARLRAKLTQSDLAERVGTSQSAIAAFEGGGTNPTLETLARYASATGLSLRLKLEPAPLADPIVERYKSDVDRTLLRDNLRKSVDERLLTLAEWQADVKELQRATALAKRRTARKPAKRT